MKAHLTTALTHPNCKLNNLKLNNNQMTDGCKKRFTGSTALTHTNCKRNKA